MDMEFANDEKIRSSSRTRTRTRMAFVLLLYFMSSFCPVRSLNLNNTTTQSFQSNKLKLIRAHLKKINKPAVKTIQSPDGDIIDCVFFHQQPAFDHPKLKGHEMSLEAPERPKGQQPSRNSFGENFQVWSMTTSSNEFCPQGTIPIRRTTEEDVLKASSVRHFGKKMAPVRRDASTQGGHEHAVGYVSGDEYYGAKASINVWAPEVENEYEFSLSQLWVISGSFGDDLNTIEAGWQVSQGLYGDTSPRLFTYWTSDAYQATGCYNLLCSGFVQTNNRIAIGAAISPTSSYNGGQFDISLLVWKDPKHGNWWLEYGSGNLVGYWPSYLFTHLRDGAANMVQFGGETVNSQSSSSSSESDDEQHTTTQMGSGHFAVQGFGKASYFRNLQVVDSDNNLIPLSNLKVLADHPQCYDVRGGNNKVWGNYIYYGGPGRNPKCH